MVFGYTEPWPTREDYHNFMEKMTEGLTSLEIPDISLMVYGSYARSNDFNPGMSDIDATLILPGGVVTDKEVLQRAGSVLATAMQDVRLKFQITPTDLKTMQDGRFNSYNPSFEAYFAEEGKVYIGPDFRESFCFKPLQHHDHGNFMYNLRKCRQGILFFEDTAKRDENKLRESFRSSLDAVTRGSKQLLFFADGKLRKWRFAALKDAKEVFPELDISLLEELHEVYTKRELLEELYHDEEKMLDCWNRSVTFLEEMIDAYIETFPMRE